MKDILVQMNLCILNLLRTINSKIFEKIDGYIRANITGRTEQAKKRKNENC